MSYFAIGVEMAKTEANVGTLWRTASIFGAAFCFTVGRRYKPQSSDTRATWKHCPIFHFADFADLFEHLPRAAPLVGVEMDPRARPLADTTHDQRAVYLLGAEDHGLSREALERCHRLVALPGESSLNVAVAGSIVIYDRVTRGVRP